MSKNLKGRFMIIAGSENRIEDPVYSDSIRKITRAATMLALHGSFVEVVDTNDNERLFLANKGQVKVDKLP